MGGCDIKIGKNSQASWAPIASKSWMLGELCAGFFLADTGPSPPQTLRVRAAGQNDPPAASPGKALAAGIGSPSLNSLNMSAMSAFRIGIRGIKIFQLTCLVKCWTKGPRLR